MRLFYDFHNWLLGLRRSGTSSLLERITKKEDVYILVATESEKNDRKWNGKALSFNDLKRDGLRPKPILMDNHAMLQFSEQAYKYAKELEQKLRDRNKLLSQIQSALLNFESQNGKFEHGNQYI